MTLRSSYSKKAVRSILREAVNTGRHFPLCIEPYATQAAGSAVVGISIRTIIEELKDVRSQIDVFCGEVDREHVFSIEKLQEHVDIAAVIKPAMRQLAGHGEQQSVVNRVINKLRKRDVGTGMHAIDQACKTLDEIATRMEEATAMARVGQSIDIESLLTDEVPKELAAVLESLDAALSEFSKLNDSTDSFWKDCVDLLKKRPKCS